MIEGGGPTGNRTRVRGFAVLYVTTPPSGPDCVKAAQMLRFRRLVNRQFARPTKYRRLLVRAPLGASSRTGVIGRARCRQLRHLAGRRPLWLLKLRQRCCRGLPHAPSTSRPRHLSVSHGRAGRLQPSAPYSALPWRSPFRDEASRYATTLASRMSNSRRGIGTSRMSASAHEVSRVAYSATRVRPEGGGRRGVRRARIGGRSLLGRVHSPDLDQTRAWRRAERTISRRHDN